jgi:hypothetical protein
MTFLSTTFFPAWNERVLQAHAGEQNGWGKYTCKVLKKKSFTPEEAAELTSKPLKERIEVIPLYNYGNYRFAAEDPPNPNIEAYKIDNCIVVHGHSDKKRKEEIEFWSRKKRVSITDGVVVLGAGCVALILLSFKTAVIVLCVLGALAAASFLHARQAHLHLKAWEFHPAHAVAEIRRVGFESGGYKKVRMYFGEDDGYPKLFRGKCSGVPADGGSPYRGEMGFIWENRKA